MNKPKKLIVFCGGTGGHFYPGLSVARLFKTNGGDAKIFLVGKHAYKQSVLAESFGLDVTILSPLPVPSGIVGKIKFLILLFFRISEVKQHLRQEHPDFVLGMGSFYSLPAVIAAKQMKIPIYLHDGNSFVGKANIFLSRYADKIALAFPPQNADKLKCPFVVTGMPLRQDLSPKSIVDKYGTSFLDIFNEKFDTDFSDSKTIFLVFGGSQGASTFNSVIPEAFALMDRDDLQIIHITGAGNKRDVEEIYRDVRSPYLVIDATEEMGLLYMLADFIVARAGGSTVAELAVFGKCAILIPFPYATNDHQTFNAKYYTSVGKSQIVNDADLVPAEFAETLLDCLYNKDDFLQHAEDISGLAHPSATEEVVDMILCK